MRYIYYDYINRPFQEQNIIMLSNRETNKLNLYKSNEWNVLSSNDTIEVNRDSIIDLVLLRLKKISNPVSVCVVQLSWYK